MPGARDARVQPPFIEPRLIIPSHGTGRPVAGLRETKTVIRRYLTLKHVAAFVAVAAGTVLVLQGMKPAAANSCAASCRAAHSQCRISTKGSPSCDAQLQSCLQACLSKR